MAPHGTVETGKVRLLTMDRLISFAERALGKVMIPPLAACMLFEDGIPG
jgi:hypothetical protein